jgi:hypothetical protein
VSDQKPYDLTRWYCLSVERPDAGGRLFAPVRVVDNQYIEHDVITPSYDEAAMKARVERLNTAEIEKMARWYADQASAEQLTQAAQITELFGRPELGELLRQLAVDIRNLARVAAGQPTSKERRA